MEDLEVVTCYMPTNQPAKQCNQIGPMSRCIDQHFATFNNETEPNSTINGQSRLKFAQCKISSYNDHWVKTKTFVRLANFLAESENNAACGQSYKHFMLVNYDSRVLLTRKLPILQL